MQSKSSLSHSHCCDSCSSLLHPCRMKMPCPPWRELVMDLEVPSQRQKGQAFIAKGLSSSCI